MVLSVSFWKRLQRRVAYLVWDYEERPLGDNIKEIQQSAFSFVGLTNFIRLYFITKWNYLMNYSARKTKHVFDDRTLCMEDFNLLWEAVSKLRNETLPKELWTQALTALDKLIIKKSPNGDTLGPVKLDNHSVRNSLCESKRIPGVSRGRSSS